jgi:hypothetical protein
MRKILYVCNFTPPEMPSSSKTTFSARFYQIRSQQTARDPLTSTLSTVTRSELVVKRSKSLRARTRSANSIDLGEKRINGASSQSTMTRSQSTRAKGELVVTRSDLPRARRE